ncbi:MAG: DUF2306 domain-containing protein [Rhodanobacteraceae bacterium]|nr:DUF2306 domain-containing protein [Xanthomonadales bacterium]MCP5474339.1 DUF2306 domain-containing protein [Rhodanobacteraceae bacterium]
MSGYLETWSHHPVGLLHVGLAMLALLTGPLLFLRRKGTRAHRVLGYGYVVAMVIANVAALARYGLTGGFNLFHAAALASLATLIPASYCAWRARVEASRGMRVAHGIFMSWTYFGLAIAFVAEFVTRRMPQLLHGDGAWIRFSVFLLLTMLLAGWMTQRLINLRILKRGSEPPSSQ